ncbi:MAG: hypothetical protein H6766_07220 [Candidatus Peribacteria bacterium]|nr:MAG: hypothetical protein H6766_07220 [Candidatus Peribacteria bacterium]
MIVRPLIEITKEEIVEICKEYDIPYRVDSTNVTEEGGQRNWMRHVLTPLIQRQNAKTPKRHNDWYDVWREWFVLVDQWRERLQGGYEVVDLPNSPFWSENIRCQGVRLIE